MADPCSFRQTDEKHASVKVEKMLWSPTMDLIAVSNKTGEVVLHRLSWQKVWTLAPPGEDIKITALIWRPDGKVLAIGYSSGQTILCNVENSTSIHTLQVKGHVTCLHWVDKYRQDKDHQKEKTEDKDEKTELYRDLSDTFLPKLSPISKSYGAISKEQSDDVVDDSKKLKDQTDLNILVVGSDIGEVELYAFGIFPIGSLLVTANIAKEVKIISACLSEDFHLLTVVLQERSKDDECSIFKMQTFKSTIIASRHQELRALALKCGQIATQLSYLDATIKQMCESWEDVLVELDAKLAKFAEEKMKLGSTSVSTDLLDLLMFGTPSSELETFLLLELGEKGVKKLTTIETSYMNIQKLILQHLHSVGHGLIYHLNDIRGMSQWFDKFGVLGLSTGDVEQAINMSGSFMMKTLELQQVIDKNLKTFKAFGRWLTISIRRLSDEHVSSEMGKLTTQDVNFVAEFLTDNLTDTSQEGTTNFKLEKVGQYLKNEDLSHPVDQSNNPWVKFVSQSKHVKDSPVLYPIYSKKSLLQMQGMLEDTVYQALKHTASVIGQSLMLTSEYHLFTQNNLKNEDRQIPLMPKISQFTVCSEDQQTHQYIICQDSSILPCRSVYLVRQATCQAGGPTALDVLGLTFQQVGSDLDRSTQPRGSEDHSIIDFENYDGQTMAVLLQEEWEDGLPVMAQVPLASLAQVPLASLPSLGPTEQWCRFTTEHKEAILPSVKCMDVGPHIDNVNIRKMENMKAHSFAVSGTRKVACVLFSSRRRVRLFLMDVEDDEEEELEIINDSQNSSNVLGENKENISADSI